MFGNNKNLPVAALLACYFATEFGTTFAFQTPNRRIHTNRFETQQIWVNNNNNMNTPYHFDTNKMTILRADNNNNNNNNETDNFDGQGFAKYLLPYAAALIGSILATAAVFKFVLLDY